MAEAKAQTPSELPMIWEQMLQKPPNERDLRLTVTLMQPLANAEMLATCRARTSRWYYNPYEYQPPLNGKEYLDLTPLCNAWRAEWKHLPEMSAFHIEFDTSLPRDENKEIVEDMHWQAGEEGSPYVHWEEYRSLALQMAILARMRTEGTVSYNVIYKREGWRRDNSEKLQDQLANLAGYSKADSHSS